MFSLPSLCSAVSLSLIYGSVIGILISGIQTVSYLEGNPLCLEKDLSKGLDYALDMLIPIVVFCMAFIYFFIYKNENYIDRVKNRKNPISLKTIGTVVGGILKYGLLAIIVTIYKVALSTTCTGQSPLLSSDPIQGMAVYTILMTAGITLGSFTSKYESRDKNKMDTNVVDFFDVFMRLAATALMYYVITDDSSQPGEMPTTCNATITALRYPLKPSNKTHVDMHKFALAVMIITATEAAFMLCDVLSLVVFKTRIPTKETPKPTNRDSFFQSGYYFALRCTCSGFVRLMIGLFIAGFLYERQYPGCMPFDNNATFTAMVVISVLTFIPTIAAIELKEYNTGANFALFTWSEYTMAAVNKMRTGQSTGSRYRAAQTLTSRLNPAV